VPGAILHLETALHLAPWEGEWRILLVEALKSQGKAEKAEEILNQAPEQSPVLQRYRARQVPGGSGV
jgi:thioredoxin-like negative regulator of GroEL